MSRLRCLIRWLSIGLVVEVCSTALTLNVVDILSRSRQGDNDLEDGTHEDELVVVGELPQDMD